jgi:hypothetical protein
MIEPFQHPYDFFRRLVQSKIVGLSDKVDQRVWDLSDRNVAVPPPNPSEHHSHSCEPQLFSLSCGARRYCAGTRPGEGDAPCREDAESVNDGDDPPEDEYSRPVDEEDTSPVKRPEIEGVRELLQSIPILTDHGSALRKFIGKWGLKWKICDHPAVEACPDL